MKTFATRYLNIGAMALMLTQLLGPLSAAPPNDMCSGAEAIPANGPFPYFTRVLANITSATTTGDPSLGTNCFNSTTGVQHSIWYQFTPGRAGLYTFSSSLDTATAVPNTMLAIYTSSNGCFGPFSQIACNDDNEKGGLQATLAVSLTSGTSYFIVLWASTFPPPSSDAAAVQLRVAKPETPQNDTCAGAEVIPSDGPFPYLTSVSDTFVATVGGDPPLPSCQKSDLFRSVWYRFTPITSGTYTITTCSSDTATTIPDTVMSVYASTGDCSGLTQVACSDDACDSQSTIAGQLVAGTNYYFVVWDFEPEFVVAETLVQLGIARLGAPSVSTLPADNITSASAVLQASVNPNGSETQAWFEWGATTNYARVTSKQAIGSGISQAAASAPISGLTAGTVYHFRGVAMNPSGLSYGLDRAFGWTNTRPTINSIYLDDGHNHRIELVAAPRQVHVIQASGRLTLWADIGAAAESQNSGSFFFVDTNAALFTNRFYRVRVP